MPCARSRGVKLTKYHPPIRRLQEEFAMRIARRKYAKARGPRPEKSKIDMDNSEPWMRNPDSVADYWYIACKVNERVEAIRKDGRLAARAGR
jgi:hypothetical protein